MQIVSIVGSLAILLAFAADQFGWINPMKVSYQALNIVGAGILTVIAIIEVQYGFILLQGVWTLVSLWKLISILRDRQSHTYSH